MTPSTAEAVLFWVLAPIMVLAALGLLFARKAVHAALCVITVMISLAFLYIAQEAPFLGVVQVVVYTGAVMMLFLFVLMLVGVDASDSLVETIRGQRWIGWLAGLGLAVVLVAVVGRAVYPDAVGLAEANAPGNPVGVARIVFGQHVFGLEVVGALLVTAALGALVLTHRQRLKPLVKQPERAAARVAAGTRLTPLPAPGVYARHNAMDVPALDPQGNPIDESVPRVLRIRGQEAGTAEFRADTYRRAVTAVLAERGAEVTPEEVEAALGTTEDEPRPPAAEPGTTTGPQTDVNLGGGSTRTETQP
ncbi:NADH:ubiquinone oxidoreductase subunit J [Cellulomonas hominis]|jgi:NADH-quinone oxidoreductase subunit J|uniref:NADH-quinone oxidoreductase subunit J n=1 Tax=Cellulomonas hominis TaxID=156981 RepID=A0A511FD18_9CELL|nr:NADH-quinone oxidoreductase subunit J [Cellulomonas hominis]MBB5472364.1 NADH-quinone oxidoreductase subunit J [Cellulomonas hominis]GEL45698.1 NADH:ubiquinone oxidoreductase subunit J [Cellulomonas hominis]